ncbi:lactate utilization protein C [Actinomadura sp. GC306]|uniref:LutC/YkgG family protein n=1 Tax=Actinomadura sp. GC306 TaxID=2530367 RepID=UPI001053B2AB|nr:LUD domain-containing protein [Actinomadura sp. GC306]TDC69347.1 lactate utilization protein C [Actinomadura sp. GC306]
MSSRELILGRVRAALADVPETEAPEDVPVPRDYRHSLPGTPGEAGPPAGPPVDALVDLLVDRLADYGAVVHRGVPVAGLLPGRVAAPPGVPPEWLTGVDAVLDDPPLPTADLDALDGVVTGCAVAIADTGTLVLDASADQGRRELTLVPDRHLCVVRTGQIVGTVPEALALLDPFRPLTWVSGPSATSDIELDRIEGVHGPRVLEVVIL